MPEGRTHIAPDGRNERKPTLFQDVRQAEVIAPDERSITKFMPYVCISPEARDALVEVVEPLITRRS